MADRADDISVGQRRHRRRERAGWSLLHSAGSKTTGHSERLVGSQEVQLYGLSPASGRTAFSGDGLAVLPDSGREGSVAAATYQRGRARGSRLAAEVPARSIAER